MKPTPIRVKEHACCSDCENPIHEVLRRAKAILPDPTYQKLYRAMRRKGLA